MLYGYCCDERKGENKLHKAYHLLKDSVCHENRYKLALVCIKMNKYDEVEKALTLKPSNDTKNVQIAGGAAGYYLLACVAERQAKLKEAIKLYHKALELNPTLWIAFERLCKLDQQVNHDIIFKDTHSIISSINSAIAHTDYFNKTGQSLNFHMQISKSRTLL